MRIRLYVLIALPKATMREQSRKLFNKPGRFTSSKTFCFSLRYCNISVAPQTKLFWLKKDLGRALMKNQEVSFQFWFISTSSTGLTLQFPSKWAHRALCHPRNPLVCTLAVTPFCFPGQAYVCGTNCPFKNWRRPSKNDLGGHSLAGTELCIEKAHLQAANKIPGDSQHSCLFTSQLHTLRFQLLYNTMWTETNYYKYFNMPTYLLKNTVPTWSLRKEPLSAPWLTWKVHVY